MTFKTANTLLLSYHGKSNKIAIELFGEDVELSNVTINQKIPMQFNLKRILILFLISVFMYSVANFEIFQKNFSEKNLLQEMILLLILEVFLLITFFINCYSKEKDSYDFYSYNFVEALSRGSFSLLEKPDDKLLNMENPYDSASRTAKNMIRNKDYIWDAALYDGKYYVYFGILPALILFLPYHLLTGNFLYSATGVLIFSVLSAIAIKALIEIVFKKYFKDVPFKYMVLSLLIMLFGSQILILNGIPRFYELPIAAGMFFSIAGIDLILMAVYRENTDYLKMFLGSLFLALSVACRPTQLITSLVIVPILLKNFVNNIKNKQNIIKNILVVAIPYLSVGLLLMYYNYYRFGNVLEFGARYQLTVIDMNHLSNRLAVLGSGLICSLFSIPNFIPSFPFIANHNDLINFYGYYYIENMIGGLFILVPICFAIFKIPLVYRKSKNRELVNFIITLTIVALIICVLSVMMGGSMQRYIVDYGWMFALAGLCIFIEIRNLYTTDEAKQILKKVFSVLTIYIIIINLCGGIISEKSYMKNLSPKNFYEIKYMVDFWE